MKSIREINLRQLTQRKTYFPSPEEWEDQILYFLLVDRFSNGQEKEKYNPATDFENALKNDKSARSWHEFGDRWNGGTISGITSKIDYLKQLGVTAIWISPILKQVAFEETYHGYGIQNFLAIDPHFGTAKDLQKLAAVAHKNGMYVILDIILNHAGNVFRYETEVPQYTGSEFQIKGFHDQNGEPTIPVESADFKKIWPDGGIWPQELLQTATFSRKGQIVNWENYPEYTEGDFFSLKNIYTGSGDYQNFQPSPALKILTECYKYWIAFADLDGFRLDTVKHLEAGATRYFVTEIHEFATTLGKNNFYIFGEITGGLEFAVDTLKKTGIDAALGINKIPEKLENVAKGYLDPVEFFNIFKNSELLGEDEYKWYKDNVVTMFDDHDMVIQSGHKSRFCADKTTAPLLLNALFLNLMSPGIPCIYYGTEACFDGSGDGDKFVREAMFGGKFGAFRSTGKHFFDNYSRVASELSKMIEIRKAHLALRQGRVYLREIAYDGKTFEIPHKLGEGRHAGVIAWSRIFSSDEIVLAINCDLENDLAVDVSIDATLHQPDELFECLYVSDTSKAASVKVNQLSGRLALHLKIPAAGCVIFRKQ